MTLGWNSTGKPKSDTSAGSPTTFMSRDKDGIEAAVTHDSGSSDPSSGAPVAWGAGDIGRVWHDRSGGEVSPKLKVWQQLAASGPTYGYRTMRLVKKKMLDTPQAVTLPTSSPAAADATWADCSLASLLNGAGVQDTSQNECAVSGVWLDVTLQTGASETIGTGATKNAYISFRKKGSTEDQRVHAMVANHEEMRRIFVALDSNEKFEFLVKVGGGTPSLAFSVSLVGFEEEL